MACNLESAMHEENCIYIDVWSCACRCGHHILQSVNYSLMHVCCTCSVFVLCVHDPIGCNSRSHTGIWERGKVIVMRSIIGVYSLNNAARPLISMKRKIAHVLITRLRLSRTAKGPLACQAGRQPRGLA